MTTLDTYEIGDTIEIPITFTNPTTLVEPSSVPDATITIFKGNTQIVPDTALTQISNGRYIFSYTIPSSAPVGVYTAYITGTVSGNLQTATLSFSVSTRLQDIRADIADVKLDIQTDKVDTDAKIASLQADIGDPSVDGTTLHAELQGILADLGNPLSTGQNITEKLDDIRIGIGLTSPSGTVTVTGVAKDSSGIPIVGVRVIAITKPSGVPADTDITDSVGSYILHLNTGAYVFEFVQANTVLKQSLDVTVPPFVTTLTIPNIVLATKRTVTDTITDPNHLPIPGVLVKAILEANYDINNIDARVESAAFTNAAGSFSLDLFPGHYVFLFVKIGFDALPQRKIVV